MGILLLLTACGQGEGPAQTVINPPSASSRPVPNITAAQGSSASPSADAADTQSPPASPNPSADITAAQGPSASPNPSADITAAQSPSASPNPSADITAAQSPSASPSPEAAPTPAALPSSSDEPAETSFLGLHGALSVDGADLVDKNGEKIQLRGVSTHGLAWFPQYVNEDCFRTLHEDWKINCIRLALYTDEYGGYCSGGDKEALKNLIKSGIDLATSQDMYVIVDWHVLNDRDPNVHKADAAAFFQELSSEYADHTNILYEICNEPNGYATWENVKTYAEEIIPVIRANDEDALILVGSPTWSQDIDKAAADPLSFDNVMYTLHFYAATHRDDLRSRLKTCADNGLPIFISEFGTCDASGNGGNDFEQTSLWMSLIEDYNLSFFCWNLSNKNETSALISSACSKTADWTEEELSTAGQWMREYLRSRD